MSTKTFKDFNTGREFDRNINEEILNKYRLHTEDSFEKSSPP